MPYGDVAEYIIVVSKAEEELEIASKIAEIDSD